MRIISGIQNKFFTIMTAQLWHLSCVGIPVLWSPELTVMLSMMMGLLLIYRDSLRPPCIYNWCPHEVMLTFWACSEDIHTYQVFLTQFIENITAKMVAIADLTVSMRNYIHYPADINVFHHEKSTLNHSHARIIPLGKTFERCMQGLQLCGLTATLQSRLCSRLHQIKYQPDTHPGFNWCLYTQLGYYPWVLWPQEAWAGLFESHRQDCMRLVT